MGYTPAEYEAMQAAWLTALPPGTSEGWERDLHTYLTHERVKSAIVDTVRYTKVITSGHASAHRETELVRKLAGKLGAAQATGGTWPASRPLTAKEIAARIWDWAHNHPA